MTRGRRGHGEGSIYQRTDGRWVAVLDLGWHAGRRKRLFLYAKTRREVVDKLAIAKRAQAAGVTVTRVQTVAQWYTTYLDKVAAPKVRASTLANYEYEYRLHIGPAIGRLRLVVRRG